MNKLIKYYLISTVSLYLVTLLTKGIVFESGVKSLFLAGAGLAAASLIVRPLINLLLLPINLITFGLFRWVSSAIALYLVTLVVPGFKIVNFFFIGLSTQWFNLPPLKLEGILAYIGFSLFISIFSSIVHWIIK